MRYRTIIARLIAAAIPACAVGTGLLSPRPAAAQAVGSVNELFLSPGAEIGLRLFGAGNGTNPASPGPNASDRLDVVGNFNFSGAAGQDGIVTVGFGRGDNVALSPGSTFTLVTFGSTNFADASRFRAAPRGDRLAAIDGTFLLLAPGGPQNAGKGALLFTLTSAAEIPEPSAVAFMAGVGLPLLIRRRRPRRSAAAVLDTPGRSC